ncbi:MAG TPA: lytic polysaccharide monooxygenase [Herpetosiphonaceae bacterium]
MIARRIPAFGLALIAAGFVLALCASLVQAHGSMQTPISRSYNCFLEGPEHPISAACQAAVAVGGTQALYDWNEINLANANGQHRSLIPDGKLCSAGRDKYKGFDLARSDWKAQTLPTSGSFTFRYRATAPHRGYFQLYVTRSGYNPTLPLKWSDLEATPFATISDPPLVDGAYVMSAQLPQGKTGRHLIYAIWQRTDSPEAFYSCSDVIFGSSTLPTATPIRTATPTPIRTPTPTPIRTATPTPTSVGVYPAWAPNTYYAVGARVSYGGKNYECIQAHTSQVGWEPPIVPALWKLI